MLSGNAYLDMDKNPVMAVATKKSAEFTPSFSGRGFPDHRRPSRGYTRPIVPSVQNEGIGSKGTRIVLMTQASQAKSRIAGQERFPFFEFRLRAME
jgi:hypothetical protein